MKTSDVLWALGGVAAVGGIGAIVYFATRPKESATAQVGGQMAAGGASGGGGSTYTPPSVIPPHVFTLSQVAGGTPGSL